MLAAKTGQERQTDKKDRQALKCWCIAEIKVRAKAKDRQKGGKGKDVGTERESPRMISGQSAFNSSSLKRHFKSVKSFLWKTFGTVMYKITERKVAFVVWYWQNWKNGLTPFFWHESRVLTATKLALARLLIGSLSSTVCTVCYVASWDEGD